MQLFSPSASPNLTYFRLSVEASSKDMETDKTNVQHDSEEDEYVLLDLNEVRGKVDIRPGTPYVLSIGEYEETVGICLMFSETERAPLVHEETGASDENLFKGIGIVDPNQPLGKEVKPITSLHKTLKLRLMSEPCHGQDSGMTTADAHSWCWI